MQNNHSWHVKSHSSLTLFLPLSVSRGIVRWKSERASEQVSDWVSESEQTFWHMLDIANYIYHVLLVALLTTWCATAQFFDLQPKEKRVRVLCESNQNSEFSTPQLTLKASERTATTKTHTHTQTHTHAHRQQTIIQHIKSRLKKSLEMNEWMNERASERELFTPT